MKEADIAIGRRALNGTAKFGRYCLALCAGAVNERSVSTIRSKKSAASAMAPAAKPGCRCSSISQFRPIPRKSGCRNRRASDTHRGRKTRKASDGTPPGRPRARPRNPCPPGAPPVRFKLARTPRTSARIVASPPPPYKPVEDDGLEKGKAKGVCCERQRAAKDEQKPGRAAPKSRAYPLPVWSDRTCVTLHARAVMHFSALDVFSRFKVKTSIPGSTWPACLPRSELARHNLRLRDSKFLLSAFVDQVLLFLIEQPCLHCTTVHQRPMKDAPITPML